MAVGCTVSTTHALTFSEIEGLSALVKRAHVSNLSFDSFLSDEMQFVDVVGSLHRDLVDAVVRFDCDSSAAGGFLTYFLAFAIGEAERNI